MIYDMIWQTNNHTEQSETLKKLVLRYLDMFVWTSVFQNPTLADTDFNMFVDEC